MPQVKAIAGAPSEGGQPGRCYRGGVSPQIATNTAGEHPDWDEYREAMARQGKSLLRVTPVRWGPVATGGFPARLA